MQYRLVELLAKDLTAAGGICCPSTQAGMQVQNTHPRQYLDVAHNGEATCPYCGTVYRLKSGEHIAAAH